jgi:hypothetical protein
MATISISRWTDWADVVTAAKNAGGNADKHCRWLGIDESNDQNAIMSFDDSLDSAVFTGAFANQDIALIKRNADIKIVQATRASAYPSIQEQMDMQYWDAINGTTTWQDAINAVKTKYPKGA